jgi:beta-N-acetylhexosaminidase
MLPALGRFVVAQGNASQNADFAARAGRYLIIGIDPDGTGELAPVLDLLAEVRPLGVILFARNMPNADALLGLNEALLEADPELLLAIDHEGGRVHRLPEPFTRFPPAMTLVRHGDPGLIRDVARVQATELRAAGFHIDFAPVLDIFTNPENRVIGDRAFGTTPEEVVHNALPSLQGLTEGGIVGCGKHFPGHGDTVADSHFELPRIDHSLERLRSLEFVPFMRAIQQGVPMIMTAHILCPALDPEVPASLSPVAIGELRDRLGFSGVIVSDDLEMRAIADNYGIGDAAVRAVNAGSDVVLVCKTPDYVRDAHRALTVALSTGAIDAERERASERRRQKLVARAHKSGSTRVARAQIGAHSHRELASRFA